MFTADTVMGPWVRQPGGNLACTAEDAAHASVNVGGEPTPGQGCLYNSKDEFSVTQAQQNFVLRIPDTNDADQFVWTGDRWQQSPDGLKGHEGQYWTLLKFDAAGRIAKLHHVDNFTLEIPADV